MARVALQVVKKLSYYEDEVSFSVKGSGAAHSLHSICPYPQRLEPEVCEYFISRYTEKGDVVLDPFCGSGVAPLSANLHGRIGYGSDLNPLGIAITEAKLAPSDITEVTLGLQSIDLRNPVNIKTYSDYFAPFYDVETFREISNLKCHFSRHRDRVSRFVRLLSLSLLHGTSAGAFSVFTHSNVSLSPSDQDALNVKRRQIPDYRPVLPRILKKSASSLRDGYPSLAEKSALKNKVALSDARNLHFVPTAGVDLALTALPLYGGVKQYSAENLKSQWLRLWFIGEQVSHIEPRFPFWSSREIWADYVNETLLELARVVRPGGRAVLDLGSSDHVDDIHDVVQNILGKYWTSECLLYSKLDSEKAPKTNILHAQSAPHNKYLVLRRW